jgi:type I restriction enzyme S subunit
VFDCTVPNNTLSRAELSYDEGTVLNVHYGDVLIKYGSVLDVQKDDIPRIPHRCRADFNGALLQDGDVIIADTAEDETTGKACEIGNLQGSAIVSGLHTMVCRPRNRMALGYLGYYLNSNAYHHQLLPLMQGIKVLSLSRSNIQKTSVSYPIAVKEQQLIAYYFSQLDNLITLHQRQPFLHSTPEISLTVQLIHPFYTSSWEQRKLGELVDVCSGRDYKHLSEGTIPVYGTGGYMLSVNDALSYDRDAIGIGRKGTIDRPYILKAPFWTVDTLFYAIPREKVDLNYAFDIFQNIDWKKKDESTGVPSLSKTAINDIDVLAPKHDEQQIIGQFFAAIDNLITLHQRKGKAAVTGCSNDANNSKGVYCKARDFGYKCYKKVKSQQIRCLIAVFIFFV